MKAAALRPGDCIGVFSSSSPISATVPVRYDRGKLYLENHGFPVADGMLRGKQDFYRSGSIRERAQEFNRLLYDDRVRVLMAAIGGNNTNSILPYIDYEYLKQHPKSSSAIPTPPPCCWRSMPEPASSPSTVRPWPLPSGNCRPMWTRPSPILCGCFQRAAPALHLPHAGSVDR
mgnify:CR=1 FL=1